jgi:pre-mRNA-splicing factor CWC22
MIEVSFVARKYQFKVHPAIESGLDLVDENDQYTHILQLDDSCDPENVLGKISISFNQIFDLFSFLDAFKYYGQYGAIEKEHKQIRKRIDKNSDDNDKSIIDQAETDLLALHRTIDSTIKSRISAEIWVK